jgi:hypothetical protein
VATKKGEGVRGVLGDLVSREKERQEQSRRPAEIAEPPLPAARPEEPREMPPRRATGIKGRPRGRKHDAGDAPAERTKVTLSIDEALRDQFYRLAHAEMIQPGEYVERALRYYIKHH